MFKWKNYCVDIGDVCKDLDTRDTRIRELEAERGRLRKALEEIIGQQPDVCFTRGCCRKCESMARIARKAQEGAGE